MDLTPKNNRRLIHLCIQGKSISLNVKYTNPLKICLWQPILKQAFVMVDTDPVISYPLMLVSKGSLTPVTITEATVDAEGITLSYNARALIPELYDTDIIVACALLKTGELLTGGQFIGRGTNVILQLKYPNLHAEQGDSPGR